jgi:hypothetical protein
MVYFRRSRRPEKQARALMKPIGIALIAIAVLITACGSPAPTPFLSPRSPSLSPLTSPLPVSYAVPFRLDRPIVAGADVVHGTGPAGVPILIADITFMGEVLGQGTIGPDGKFTIKVKLLEAGHRIGLGLAELAGTQWKAEDFYPAEFFGPDAMQVPQVGFFHDTVMVPSQ